jgi:FMN phosphatase YigB (HAD superfamily)
MKIDAARAHACSTVIWDVGGTIVDHVVGRMEALARAFEAVGLRLEAVDAATLERADQHFLLTKPRWGTLEEERLGVEARTAVFIGNDPDLDILPARAAGLIAVHFDPRRQYAGADAHDVPALRQRLLPFVGLPTGGRSL